MNEQAERVLSIHFGRQEVRSWQRLLQQRRREREVFFVTPSLSFPAFFSGLTAVLLFHQGFLSILHAVGFTPVAPFPTQLTRPFGLPQIWSPAFWERGMGPNPGEGGPVASPGAGYWEVPRVRSRPTASLSPEWRSNADE